MTERVTCSCSRPIRYRGRWYQVSRVNPKSVTVKMASGTGSVRYRDIAEYRRAGPHCPDPGVALREVCLT